MVSSFIDMKKLMETYDCKIIFVKNAKFLVFVLLALCLNTYGVYMISPSYRYSYVLPPPCPPFLNVNCSSDTAVDVDRLVGLRGLDLQVGVPLHVLHHPLLPLHNFEAFLLA